MALEIVLVRHGESAGNRDRVFTGHGPSPLTDLGRLQAQATANALWDHARTRAAPDGQQAPVLDAIYASDLPRAAETAAPLAGLAGLDPIPHPALRERDIGAWTGLTFEEVQAASPEGWQALLSRDPDFRPPGGESHRDCRQRVGAFLDDLFARHPSGRMALYSHGVAINHLLRHVLGVGPGDGRFFFQIENCALSRFERRDDGAFRIFCVNDVAHLGAVDRTTPGSSPAPAASE